MFRAARRVSTDVSSKSKIFGLACFMPILALLGALGGCETGAQWVDPATADQHPNSVDEPIENSPTCPEENEQVTVTCTANGLTSFSMFTHIPSSLSASNGTAPICARPPCSIEPSLEAKGNEVTVRFAIDPLYFATFGTPVLQFTGTLKGGNSFGIATKTFAPPLPISWNDDSDRLTITVDAAEFASVTSATLSWIPEETMSDSAAATDWKTAFTKSPKTGFSRKATPSIMLVLGNLLNEAVTIPPNSLEECCSYCCDDIGCVCVEKAPRGYNCP